MPLGSVTFRFAGSDALVFRDDVTGSTGLHLIVESANRDRIPVEQIPQMIGALTGALARHMAGLSKKPWDESET